MNVLFVCGGNTCRSPMARVIIEEMLKAKGIADEAVVDSAAYDGPTLDTASGGAREAIRCMFGDDLLASHCTKGLDDELVDWADMILVMTSRMKIGLPAKKTCTLREYAGQTGDIVDPWGKGVENYVKCAKEIQGCIVSAWPRLATQLEHVAE